MRRRRRRKKQWPPPPLIESKILEWADAHHALKGTWPTRKCGTVHGSWTERWSAIHAALQKGHRGLPGGSSLPRFLAKHRGVRNRKGLSPLTVPRILRWADSFHKQNAEWPHHDTKPAIPGTNGETWLGVDSALRSGIRGLPGGSSLARVLAEHRDVRNPGDLPPLSVGRVLEWADAFHERTGEWPKQKNWREAIPGTNGETWGNIIQAIALGLRGFPGGSTLFDLLSEHRGVRNVGNLLALTEDQILAWADAFFARHGGWPTCRCQDQLIPGTVGERWFNIDQALRKGLRGLPDGSSLPKLLARRRGVPNSKSSMEGRMATPNA